MNTTKNTPKKHHALRISLSLLLVVAALSGGLFFYHQNQKNKAIAKERTQYVQAEKDIDALTAQITTKFGQPDDSKKVKSCGYTSVEFGRGDRYCSVNRDLTYTVVSIDDAKSKVSLFESWINSSGLFKVNHTSDTQALLPTPIELLSASLFSHTRLNCSVTYLYYLANDRSSGYSYLPQVANAGLNIAISCGSRPALAAYYPIVQD